MLSKLRTRVMLAVVLLLALLACRTADVFIAQATITPTRTPRPTYTPIPTATNTPEPTLTATAAPTFTRSPTPRPTARPATRVPTPKPAQPTAPPAPTISPMEFHVNPPFPCQHSGMTYLKGTVYTDKNDPNSKYVGAIVALGPPDGSTIYDVIKTDGYGEYTFVLSGPNEPGRTGTWALWLVDPSHRRKSDISAPIITNGLPVDNPNSCWTSGVDFWK